MNRKKLAALLAAGLINQQQHDDALRSCDGFGLVTSLPELAMEAAALGVRLELDEPADDGSITISADITRYDELIPSHQLVIHAGSLTVRQPLSNTKLLRDHDMRDPVGFMTEVDAEVVHASFQVAASQAARVKQEIDDKLRDGISIGFLITEYDIDDDWVLHCLAGEIHEASLCAIPAVNSARVTDVAAALATARTTNRKDSTTVNREQLAAALAAGTITQAEHDAGIALLDALEAALQAGTIEAVPAAAPVVPLAVAAGPDRLTTQPAPVVVTEHMGLPQVARRLADAYNTLGADDPIASVNLAIADIIPADDAGEAFVNREDWVGEVWRATDDGRPWIDAIGTPEQMTRLKGKGWRWGRIDDSDPEEPVEVPGEPDVAEYAGNKTEVPSNEIGTLEATFDSFRIAAAWDIDRAYFDFSSEEFWSSFIEAATRNYKRKSNAGIRTRVLALATDTPTADVDETAAGGISSVLKQLRRDVRRIAGGRANRIFLGDTLYDMIEDLDTEHLPLWLRGAAFGVEEGPNPEATVGQLRIVNDPALAVKEAVVFDSRALKVKERSPFWVQALNIPRGGVDAGVFSYLRLEDHDDRLIVKRNYA